MSIQGVILDIPPSVEREQAVRSLRSSRAPLLILDTCQRFEVYGLDDLSLAEVPVSKKWQAKEAFERLARIAAGLESRVLGELEVLGQVRAAYKELRARDGVDRRSLDRIVQDALALARKARRKSGIDTQLTSIGSLAARDILAQVPTAAPLAVIGSGSLALAVIRYIGKRGRASVRVTSRCPENAAELALKVGGFSGGLDQLSHLLEGVGGIICATAAPHPVLYPTHLEAAARPLHIIDLSVPPDCSGDVPALPDVHYRDLESVEATAQGNRAERTERAGVAAAIIRDGAIAWSRAR